MSLCFYTASVVLLEASALTINCSLRSGIAKIGLEAKACLISPKAFSQSGFQITWFGFSFFSNEVKGAILCERKGIKFL